MTEIKFCGLTRPCEIDAAKELGAGYVGFVFVHGSRRYIEPGRAAVLKQMLPPGMRAVGVFAGETVRTVADLLNRGVIDMAQLHGGEDEGYVRVLRNRTDRPVIRAVCIRGPRDAAEAEQSDADYLLLDSGAGSGQVFDWGLIGEIRKPYFLAGGLDPGNVGAAIRRLRPYAVDVSSGIETDGVKDRQKMAAFAAAVRKEGEK